MGRPMLSDRCPVCLSVCLSVGLSVLSVTLVHSGQTVGRIKIKLGKQVGLGSGHIVLDGHPAPLPQRGTVPQFSVHFYCGQTAGCIKMPLGMEVRLGPDNFVLDGDHVPHPQKWGEPPKFSAHVYYGKTARWIKMTLGMEVNLNQGDFVFDGDPAPSPKTEAEPPSPMFGTFILWPNGWMHQDVTWYGDRSQPRGLYWMRTQPPSVKRGEAPNFRHMFIAAKRLHGSRCHLVRR